MEYKASLDSLAKIITIGVIIFFVAIGWQNLKVLFIAQGNTRIILIHIGVLLLLVVIIIGSWIFAPQSYKVDNTDLTINRAVGKVKIKLADITQVRSLGDNEMKGTIRTFGVGGLFGYFGKFHVPNIGYATFFATQRQKRILITTKQDKKIVLTPDNMSIVEKIKP